MGFKRLIVIYLTFLHLISNLNGQDENFIDNVYKQIVIQNIEVLDSSWNVIHHKKLRNLIYRNDTICLFNPENDKFLNSSFIPRSIATFVHCYNIDSITNIQDSNYLNFIHRAFDEDTELLLWEVEIFRIRKANLDFKSPIKKDLDSLIINRQFESWKIDSIQYYDHFLDLDSCHLVYNLRLLPNGNFEQFYGIKDTFCNIILDSFFFHNNEYFDKIVNHEITAISGHWLARNGILYLFVKGKPLFEFPYVVSNNNLILFFDRNSSTIFKRL